MKEEQINGENAPVNDSEQVMDESQTREGGTTGETGNEPPAQNQEMSGTGEEAKEIESEVVKLSNELNEIKDKHLRLYSEFENYRRRTAKERLELINSANADLIMSLLPVLDDFERAMEAAQQSESAEENQGIHLIYQKLLRELNNKGLKPMEGLEGKSFDAENHEAISQTPAPKKKLKNKIVHVVEKGYYLNDKVLRYAKVVIGT